MVLERGEGGKKNHSEGGGATHLQNFGSAWGETQPAAGTPGEEAVLKRLAFSKAEKTHKVSWTEQNRKSVQKGLNIRPALRECGTTALRSHGAHDRKN